MKKLLTTVLVFLTLTGYTQTAAWLTSKPQDLSLDGHILSLTQDATTVDLDTLEPWRNPDGTAATNLSSKVGYTRGFVGVGTLNPDLDFHVYGNKNTRFGVAAYIQNINTGALAGARLHFAAAGNNFYIQNYSIGSPTPGRTEFKSTASGSHYVFNVLGKNNALTVASNGNIGIGTTVPTATLSVNGSANKVGGGTWSVFSDNRAKRNISVYKKGLKEILQLKPKKFFYKRSYGWGTEEYVGLLAQEAELVEPSLVTKQSIGEISDFRVLNPNQLIYMLINAVQELNTELEETKKLLRK